MAFLLGLTLLTGLAPAAHAHSDLVSSTPENGATLAAMPESVTLVFNEEIDPNFAQAVVSDAKDIARPQTPGVKGATLTVPIPAEVPDGAVEVRYRIVSKDGHPVAGTLAFTAGPPAATGSTTDTAMPVAPGTASDGTQTPAPRATTQPSVPEREEAANTWMYALTGVAVLLVAAVGAAIFFMTRHRH